MKIWTSIIFSLLMSVIAGAVAQEKFPDRPIRLIVPLSPGGNVDIVARAIAQGMSKELGQSVIVENKPGASSTIGTAHVAKAPADGYTMLAMGNTFVSAPKLMSNPGYHPIKDFEGLSRTVSIPMVLVTKASLPVRNVKELIGYVNNQTQGGTYGSAGPGSTSHLAAELFADMSGVKLMHVPYKGNSAALIDVMGGQVTMMFDQIGSSAAHIRNGNLKALGVTSKTRSPAFPDVPTIHESGVPGYEDVTFNGIVLRSGTPKPIVARLNAALNKVLSDPELKKRFSELGIQVDPSASPAEFNAYLAAESEKYGKLVKDRAIVAQ